MVLVQFVHSFGLPNWYSTSGLSFFGDWQYGLITGAIVWSVGGTLFPIALGWLLRLVGVEYDLQKKEVHIHLVIAKMMATFVGELMNLDDVPIIFISSIF